MPNEESGEHTLRRHLLHLHLLRFHLHLRRFQMNVFDPILKKTNTQHEK